LAIRILSFAVNGGFALRMLPDLDFAPPQVDSFAHPVVLRRPPLQRIMQRWDGGYACASRV
jgi:hypothetical protein